MFAMTMSGDSKSLPEPGILGVFSGSAARRAAVRCTWAARVDARRGVTRGTSTLEVRT